jgi:xanthine/uracil permease
MLSTRVRIFLFLSMLFTALAMAAGLAHLFELPNKLKLSAEDYRVVQQIYRGWSLLGIVVFGSLISILALAIVLRKRRTLFPLAVAAFSCMVAAQAVFWTFTFPVNVQTENWTVLPANWVQLRNRWEYSHAAGAAFDLAALITLILVALVQSSDRPGADRSPPQAWKLRR